MEYGFGFYYSWWYSIIFLLFNYGLNVLFQEVKRQHKTKALKILQIVNSVYSQVLLKDLAWTIEEVTEGGHGTTTDFILPDTLKNGDGYNISYSNGFRVRCRTNTSLRFYNFNLYLFK